MSSDGASFPTSKVTFTSIDVPGGHRAFVLEDLDDGNRLTFIEIGAADDEWALKVNDNPELSFLSTAEARELAFLTDKYGVAKGAQLPVLAAAA